MYNIDIFYFTSFLFPSQMTADLSIEFEAIPFSVDDDQKVIVSNTILQIKFTIRDNEISQSIQLDGQQQYILRATLTTKEQLCAVQVVLLYKKLGKIAQNMRFQISQLKKIIKSRDPKFWDNIGLVAAQMGLRVLSIKCTCDYYFAKFAQSIEGYDLQYFSLYNSFDTEQLLQPEVIEDLNFHENQVLLQLAAIKYQKVGEYHLILPLIFGYSAFRLYDTQFKKLKKNTITRDVYGEDLDLLKKIFEVSNKIYKGESFTEKEKPYLDKFDLINLFQLPFHFLNTGICLFMFQQLCHVSYLFKAEYFALFSLVKNDLNDTLTNAVISQSSKSGKSVALYTQYFFHLLMGNVPILFNMKSDKEQPLYEYYTENFHSNLGQQYIDVYKLSEIKQISNVKELKEVEDLKKDKESKEVEDLKKDKELNKIILQSVCAFHQFQLDSIGKVSELFYKMVIFIENITKIKNVKGNKSFNLLDAVKKLQYNNHIFTKFELFQNQIFFIYNNHKDTSGISDDQILERSKKPALHLTPIILVDECLQSQKSKFPKCVKLCQMIFMRYEEKLIQLGKKQYIKIQTMLDSDEFKVINTFAAIKYKQHHLVINVILPLLSKELLESAKTEPDNINVADRFQNKGIDLYQTLENIITSVQSKNADQRFNTIHANQGIIVEYFKSLNSLLGKSEYILIAMEYLRLEIDDYDLLDELVVHSPQILNIRNRTQFREIFFSGMVSYRNRGQYYEDFETNFYKLILSLFNPRGIETAFWKTFSIVAMRFVDINETILRPKDIHEDLEISLQFVTQKFWKYSVIELIQEYFAVSKSPDLEEDQRKEQQVENFISMFHEKHKPLLESLQKTFDTTKLLFVPNVKQSTVIMVGTDLTVINFLTVNQFCYNAMSSRANMGYINTQILGYVQPHASLLSSLQYEQRRMVVDATGYVKSVGAIPGTVKTFAKDTPILVSLLYSMMTEKSVEMQFMCSSVCPSIWFQYNQKILNFNATSRHVVSVYIKSEDERAEHTMYQFDSLTQTYNNIIIHKGAENDAKFKLTKGDAHFELLQDNQNYNISCIASSTLNYEVVSVLNYQLMLAFIAKYSTSQIDEAAAQDTLQQLSKFFQRSVLLEFMQVILFVAKLTLQTATLITNISLIMRYVDTGHIYVQYLHGGSIDSEKSKNVFKLLQDISGGHQFIFMNPTFDYAFQNYNTHQETSGKATVYNQILQDSIQSAKEAFEVLKQQNKSMKTLIVVIPFDKKMCFSQSLETDSYRIFDFILTFHGYKKLDLQSIYNCQVLPVECGHHIVEVLKEKIQAFELSNVVQIGLDKEQSFQILKMKKDSDDFVKGQQKTEREVIVKEAAIIEGQKMICLVYQIIQLAPEQKIKLTKLYTNSRYFLVLQHQNTHYIQIITIAADKKIVLQSLKDAEITLLQGENDNINLDKFLKISAYPECEIFFQDSFAKLITIGKEFKLDLSRVENIDNIMCKLEQLKDLLEIQQIPDQEDKNLTIKLIADYDNLMFAYLTLDTIFVYAKDSLLSVVVKAQSNIQAVYYYDKDNKNINERTKTLYDYNQDNIMQFYLDKEIDLDVKGFDLLKPTNTQQKITIQYEGEDFWISVTYQQLEKEVQYIKNTIYKIEGTKVYLKCSNLFLPQLVKPNIKILELMTKQQKKYYSLLKSANLKKQDEKLEELPQFLLSQDIIQQVDSVHKLIETVQHENQPTVFQIKFIGSPQTVKQKKQFVGGIFRTEESLDAKQVLELFIEMNAVAYDIVQKVLNGAEMKYVKIYFFE
ncbi:hypothetical protein SS50377_24564 [Spironucleus salmonicida]|uniref:Uncharacterized protein n=1 Tax=Spironucleus salmonicida TaxID=348837 RepID=A0A9P8LQL1_9EUKA|nr:hypothetical protein SS50377_24564 [Spironucleus salmonicida]